MPSAVPLIGLPLDPSLPTSTDRKRLYHDASSPDVLRLSRVSGLTTRGHVRSSRAPPSSACCQISMPLPRSQLLRERCAVQDTFAHALSTPTSLSSLANGTQRRFIRKQVETGAIRRERVLFAERRVYRGEIRSVIQGYTRMTAIVAIVITG